MVQVVQVVGFAMRALRREERALCWVLAGIHVDLLVTCRRDGDVVAMPYECSVLRLGMYSTLSVCSCHCN